MKKISVIYFTVSFIFCQVSTQNQLSINFWTGLSEPEKISFVNGAYGTISLLKKHHQHEVRKQYLHDKNWVQPYYIERFYDIADEYRSEEAGYNLKIIVMHMNAFYSNSDNIKIPILEAMRIVSLMQDGYRDKANIRLLQAQRKY
ncbi:MAG: hypothetical protein CMG33_01655 [Candidatus Marinimicrobia bacterium]|nr:hypothetical protein [Candidatus Neomarinimicrobiota bacterium]MBO62213.1 hypothetical protein [Candidatus Neomarinimicrobiota bacterium]|tara:strand:- start:166 stop:600 length:435 start_codon:yes stop_codon:yes gene_type:complete